LVRNIEITNITLLLNHELKIVKEEDLIDLSLI